MAESNTPPAGLAATDRRRSARIPVEMWVVETESQGEIFRRSGNISRGGLLLDQAVPLPLGTSLDLAFTLPGDGSPIRVSGRIVSHPAGREFGMGIKFVRIAPEAEARIGAFLDGAGGA